MSVPRIRVKNATDTKEFDCDWYIMTANRRSCFGCEHCAGIFFDYTYGPYLFFCEKGVGSKLNVLRYGCELFKEET